MDQVARDVASLLGGDQDSCWVLDETCFPKRGKKSVGVARQWMGRQGKTDNCQVAVFAAPARGGSVSLIDAELYLPQEWVKDPRRCAAAGIPAERQVLKTKPALALELVQRVHRNGVSFAWVTGDGGYGQNRALLRALDHSGEIFVATRGRAASDEHGPAAGATNGSILVVFGAVCGSRKHGWLPLSPRPSVAPARKKLSATTGQAAALFASTRSPRSSSLWISRRATRSRWR